MSTRLRLISILLLAFLLMSANGGLIIPTLQEVTQVTYVYEKDQNAVPRPIAFALSQLNAQGILATPFEQDTVDGDNQIPEQYSVALAAGKEAGLPCLVVQSGDHVLRVVANPKTEQDVIGAL